MKRKIISILFALVLVLSFSLMSAVPAAAVIDEVWVATTGLDTNPGTQGSPFLTIQRGITAVLSPGKVNVADGDYNEDITLKNGVQVLGAGEASTFINGTGTGSVVTASDVGSATKLDGFTITGGNTPASGGGGMYIVISELTVSNCTFSGNTAPVASTLAGLGGGMHNKNSSPTITNCTFSGNSANQGGGGMANSGGSPTVTDCTFFDNSTDFSGAGMANRDGSTPTVTDCTFYNNTGYFVGGMYNSGSPATVTNCTFYGNTGQDGGGMANSSCSPTVTNCIFYGNTASSDGGGMYNENSSPTVTNCTFSGNSADYDGGAMCSRGDCAAMVANCILWGDIINPWGEGPEIYDWPGVPGSIPPSTTTVTYSDIEGGWPGTGNNNYNPWFSNPAAGDYHLKSGSPCIDAGNNTAVPAWLTTDFEGDPRIIGAAVDMGADEFLPHEVWVAITGSDTNPGTGALPFATIQMGIDTVAEGGTVNVAAGTYSEWQDVSAFGAGKSTGIMIDKSLIVEGANAGIPVTEERGPESIINAQEADMGVLINGEGTIATFDGFTVDNYDTAGILAGAFGYWGEDPIEVHILNNIAMPPTLAAPHNNCIQVADGTTGTIIGNEVSGATLESPDWSGSGILVSGSSNVLVSNNYVHDCEGGIQIQGYAEYRDAPAENNIIEYNLVEGNESGIVPQMNSIGTIIRYNDVLINDEGIAVMAIDYTWEHSAPSGTEIHSNNIVGNIDGVVSGVWGSDTGLVTAELVDATNNWWGNASGPTHAGNTFNVGEQGDAVSDNVLYVPWHDTDMAGTSFAPVENTDTSKQFSSIQAAIDDADTLGGHTITVAAGIYNENVLINKSLTLQGADKTTTIIDGGGSGVVVAIFASDVTVSGFTVTGSGSFVIVGEELVLFGGVGLLGVTGCTIVDNIVSDNDGVGIGLKDANENLISNNILDANHIAGIGLMGSKDNTIEENVSTGTGEVIIPTGPESANHMGYGIILEYGPSGHSTGNTVTDNIFSGNEIDGVYFGEGGHDNILTNNTITNNGKVSGVDAHGVYFWRGGDNTVTGNTITGNLASGIQLMMSQDNTITQNTITGNNVDAREGEGGILIRSDVIEGIFSTGNLVNYNSIFGNTNYGINTDTAVDATNNWWGDASGPGGVGAGAGDAISDNVDYSPWCTDSDYTEISHIQVDDVGEYVFNTIQSAIDAANDGDTINVAAGTYTEQVNIEESLTITGDGQDTTHIVSPEPTTMTIYDYFGSKGSNARYIVHRGTNIPVVRIAASDVTFEGFHVDLNDQAFFDVLGTGSDPTYSKGVGILVDHVETIPETPDEFTGVVIQNNKVDGLLWDDYSDCIKVLAQATVNINHNILYGYGESAISAQGMDNPRAAFYPTVTANDNTMYGGSDAREGNHFFFGVGFWSGATGSADGNTIYNAPNGNGYALNSWTPNPVSFTNNIILTDGGTVGGYGAQLYESSNLIFSGNDIQDQGLAGAIWKGGGTGITITITNNNISNCIDGFIGDGLTAGSVTLHYNNFSGTADGHYALDMMGHEVSIWGSADPSTITADATNNWWDDASGPYHATTNPDGLGNAVSDNVDYDPWFGAGVEDSKSEKTDPDEDIVDAKDEVDTTVFKKGSGTPTITVTKYTDNPGDGAPGGFSSAGKYIDVHISSTTDVDEIEIWNYYTLADIAGLNEETLKLSWWDGTAWIECSNSGVTVTYPADEPYRGYVWAIIKALGAIPPTIPTLDDLAGTPFMSMAAPAPAGGGGGGGPPPLPAGTTDVRGMISTAGIFYTSATPDSEDGLCTLTIPAGTVGLTEELEPLTIITMLIMDDPPPPPEGAHVIGLFYDFQPSGATFEPPITLTFNYDPADIPDGIAEENLVLAYYDQKAGKWVNLEGTVATGLNTITVLISHFTAFAILGYEVPEPAAFTPGSLVISPTEVDIDQAVNVSLSVANTGGMAGSYKVTLKIDGEVEATQQVTVSPGASETVTFTTSRDVAGSYSVDVNGLSGSFTVKEEVAPAPPAPPPAPPPEVKAPINWPVVGGLIAAVVLAGLLFFLIRRRRAL